MSNKELLELAAKAFWGKEIGDVCSVRWLEEERAIGYTHGDDQDHNGLDRELVWNPIDDDGDALRLAVKLGIEYGFGYNAVGSIQRVIVDDDLYVVVENNDPCAATRRAITRAAAEIGRMMP